MQTKKELIQELRQKLNHYIPYVGLPCKCEECYKYFARIVQILNMLEDEQYDL